MKKKDICRISWPILLFLLIGFGGACTAIPPSSPPSPAQDPATGPNTTAQTKGDSDITEENLSPDPDYTPPPFIVHEVRFPGETLSIIALWYTGDLNNWPALAEFNPELNPNRVYIGNKIRVPIELLKKRTPLPKAFLSQFLPKSPPKEPEPKSEPQAKPSDAPPKEQKAPPKKNVILFGPKE